MRCAWAIGVAEALYVSTSNGSDLNGGVGADVADQGAVCAVDAHQEQRLDAPQAGVLHSAPHTAKGLGCPEACTIGPKSQ